MQRSRVEMIFIIAMVVLCGGLTVLQYHWTGELARAEMTRLSTSLSDQVALACKSFDAELRQARTVLVPTASELNRGTREAVHVAKFREWKSGNPRPIFKRIAVAVPAGDDLTSFEIDQKSERLMPVKWPSGWSDLQANLLDTLQGGPPPKRDRSGMILELPVMGGGPGGPDGPGGFGGPGGPDDGFGGPGGPPGPGGPRGGGGEREWIILELDADYLTNTWLPELVSTNLNPEGKRLHDVTVRTRMSPSKVIFSTGGDPPTDRANSLTVNFNYQGANPDNSRGGPMEPVWIMETSRRDGAFEAAVAGSRKKNLAIAVLLNGLIVAAGWMLLRVTRHSRRLAEEQMKFVANVTHELRTPLTVIRGAAHNLKRGIVKDQEGIAKYSSLILEHAESLGGMVEQVLDFSGAQAGQLGNERQPVDIAGVLRSAISTLKNDAEFSGCEIDLNLPPDLTTVTGDPSALRRAVMNLIENAAKHGGAGGWIGVSARMLGSRLEIQVADRGPGIPHDELREIFKPFFRGGIARSQQVRGNGLGLSLVKEIVTAHGGTISVESETGKGSVFTISLPAEGPVK